MRMLVDAEHSYFQPAIDALTIALQQKFNREEAVIMNTYQCYLTVSTHPLHSLLPWFNAALAADELLKGHTTGK